MEPVKRNLVAAQAVGQVGTVKELKSLSHSGIEDRKLKLTKFIVPKGGGRVDEGVKLGTVNILIGSAKCRPQKAVEDLEFLCGLGITFEPIKTVHGPMTQKQAYTLLGVGRTTISPILKDKEKFARWGAERVAGNEWSIPADTINKANVELKTSIPLIDLYRLLGRRGVRKEYYYFKSLFPEPSAIDRDAASNEGRQFLEDLYGGYRRYADVVSAAEVSRRLLHEKERLDEGVSSEQMGRLLGVTYHHVNLLVRQGKIPGHVVAGRQGGRLLVRLTAADAAAAFISRIDTSKTPPKYMIEYPKKSDDRKTILTKMFVEGKIKGYASIGDVPGDVINELGKFDVVIRKENDEELRTRVVSDTLLKRFGSIQGIAENVPEAVLTELGLRIREEDGGWHIRRIKPDKK